MSKHEQAVTRENYTGERKADVYIEDIRENERREKDKLVTALALHARELSEDWKGVSVGAVTEAYVGVIIGARMKHSVPAERVFLAVGPQLKKFEDPMQAGVHVRVRADSHEIVGQEVTLSHHASAEGDADDEERALAVAQKVAMDMHGRPTSDEDYAEKFPAQYRQGLQQIDKIVELLKSIGYHDKRGDIERRRAELAEQYFNNPSSAPLVRGGFVNAEVIKGLRIDNKRQWADAEARKQAWFEVETGLNVPYCAP